jgi:signal transduction histidine kinase
MAMTLLEGLSVSSATAGFWVGLIVHQFARAPNWRALRQFTFVALTAGLYAACSIVTLGTVAPSLVMPFVGLQIVCTGLHVLAWSRYADAVLHEPAPAWRSWTMRAVALASTLALWPGLCFTGEVRSRVLAGILYLDPVTTPWGDTLFALLLLAFFGVGWRFARAARRGVPRALVGALCIALLALMAVSDIFTAAGIQNMPYLLDAGFVVPVGFAAYELIVSFGEDAKALAALRTRLEALVADRTQALEASQRALVRAESLAALGRVAASVAHELNNPAAVISSTLEYLQAAVARGSLPADAAECLRDAEQATQRIAEISRQLHDSSRLPAGTRQETVPVAVLPVIEEALHLARQRLPAAVSLHTSADGALRVAGQSDALAQALLRLVINGGEAIADSGVGSCVRVAASRDGEHIQIVVEDDGPGMSDQVLGRALEPFFTTKPVGRGVGLGLAVARGLIASMGGELQLDSAPSKGTRATITLQEAGVEVSSTSPAYEVQRSA